MSKLLQYAPQKRMTAHQAMTHPFFDELREPGTKLPNGAPLLPRVSFPPSHLPDSCSPGGAGGSRKRTKAQRASSPLTFVLLFLRRPAGKPLPPLFNWLPGEMDEVPADVMRKLQPKAAAA